MVSAAPEAASTKTQIASTLVHLRQLPRFPLAVLTVLLLSALLADFLAPHSPYKISLSEQLKPPFWMEGGSTKFLLGTDAQGRDILSRIIFGARVSTTILLFGLLVSGAIGCLLGMIAGYYGGWVDGLIMRTCDGVLSLPTILLALLFAVVLGPNLTNLVVIVIIVLWARYARVIRGEVLSWKQRDFVAYARATGASRARILVRHLFPNVVNTLLVLATFQAGYVIILEASLSFLGAGVPPPTPSWGGMAAAGKEQITTAWWLTAIPGTTIVATCLALNLLGDWLRDRLDPRLRQV